MSALDSLRDQILARRADAHHRWQIAEQDVAIASAELDAHDRAVSLFAPQTAPPKKRAARRDFAELVLAALTDEPQSIGQLAAKTEIVPRRVLRALQQLGPRSVWHSGTDMWVRGVRP